MGWGGLKNGEVGTQLADQQKASGLDCQRDRPRQSRNAYGGVRSVFAKGAEAEKAVIVRRSTRGEQIILTLRIMEHVKEDNQSQSGEHTNER